MKRKKRKREYAGPKLEMTPMIDVVFQLLIFFVVTLKQEDLLSRLDVNRPQGATASSDVAAVPLLDIVVEKDGYILQGVPVELAEIDRQTAQLSLFSKKSSVVVRCMTDSPHSYLIRILDVLSKNKLVNINVFTISAR